MKAKVVVIILIILLCKNNFAQNIDVNFPYASAIENAEFDKAEKKIMNAYAKDSTDIMICYAAYRLYISKESSIYDLEKAYSFLMRSTTGYNSLDDKEREKLTKKNLTKNVLKADMQKTVNLGLEVAIAVNTLDSYNHFLDFYSKGMTQYQRIDACNGRNALEFNEAKRINTIESYQRFIDLRPNSREIYEAELLRNELAYKQVEAENTISAYESFVRKYPRAKETPHVKEILYDLAYDEAKNLNTENSYRVYANKYPDSPYAKSAEEQANSMQFARETKKGDWESYKNYIIEHTILIEMVLIFNL